MLKNTILTYLAILFIFQAIPAIAEPEHSTTYEDQHGVFVTIYNNDLALVKDLRTLKLPKGKSILAFKEVSAQMKPETALLTASGLSVLEQNFEFDLLTPQSLLKKYVGKEVTVVQKHPTTGEESREKGKVLSAQNGVVLQMSDRIETGIPGRLIFSDVPKNLRDRPTLTMLIQNDINTQQDVELSYLTNGLGWKADYVAELNSTDDAINLSGWVTLTNRSGANYKNANLQLVAGDVNIVSPVRPKGTYRAKQMEMAVAMDSPMAEEQMFEYHLYTLGRTTTIKDNQTKQVSLLQAEKVPCAKEFVLHGNRNYYRHQYRDIDQKNKIKVFLEVKNSKGNNLGIPLPKGIVRVYKKDSQKRLQFIGEDSIDHTPENETVRLKLGEAFDLTATRRQTDYKRISKSSSSNNKFVYESSHEIEIKNGKKETVTIKVEESIPGDWTITEESQPHEKAAANRAIWYVKIPGLSETVLSYRVRVTTSN